MPSPDGPVCRGPGSPGGVDGMKVVFEARGSNFRIMGSPPPDIAKSAIPVRDLWERSTRITTKVGTALGLDLMEFTVHCTRGFP